MKAVIDLTVCANNDIDLYVIYYFNQTSKKNYELKEKSIFVFVGGCFQSFKLPNKF